MRKVIFCESCHQEQEHFDWRRHLLNCSHCESNSGELNVYNRFLVLESDSLSLLLILVDSRFSEIGIKIKKQERVNARALTVVAVADGASDAAPVAD